MARVTQLKILALSPHHGGSHKAFLDGWIAQSRHAWTVLSLPAYKWKWRMRHASLTLARQAEERVRSGAEFDAIWCTDMLNLPEWRGFAPARLARHPAILYFHENQFSYPARYQQKRDFHFSYTNFLSAVNADALWFNSAFHQNDFLVAAQKRIAAMPDYQHVDEFSIIGAKSCVHSPGITFPAEPPHKQPGPLHILWAARWEHDKDPETFFAACRQLRAQGVAFVLSVIGEQFQDSPEVFAKAEVEFIDCIRQWGFQPSREQYETVLDEADVIVSTAQHEFFGISVVEAMAHGATPLLPTRLAYPELLDTQAHPTHRACLYDGSAEGCANALQALAEQKQRDSLLAIPPDLWSSLRKRYDWSIRATAMDCALEALVS